MNRGIIRRRDLLAGAAAGAAMMAAQHAAGQPGINLSETQESLMINMNFTKKEAPEWLLAFWREIDDKTFGKGFDCFVEDATCRLGVAEWNGRETIRENLRAFIDTGFTAHHDITEYWDGGSLKVFRGLVTMTPNDRSKPAVKPVMTHFFYMDQTDTSKVRSWVGSVGPIGL